MNSLVQSKTQENKNSIINILKGIGIAYIFTLALLLIFSILLTYTKISEQTIPTVVLIITAISILFGSSIASRKIKKNGLINGGIIGFSYIIFLYIISSLVNTGFNLNLYSILMIVFSIIAGIIGGIVGVNMHRK